MSGFNMSGFNMSGWPNHSYMRAPGMLRTEGAHERSHMSGFKNERIRQYERAHMSGFENERFRQYERSHMSGFVSTKPLISKFKTAHIALYERF
jgi:hypothetical protein